MMINKEEKLSQLLIKNLQYLIIIKKIQNKTELNKTFLHQHIRETNTCTINNEGN